MHHFSEFLPFLAGLLATATGNPLKVDFSVDITADAKQHVLSQAAGEPNPPSFSKAVDE